MRAIKLFIYHCVLFTFLYTDISRIPPKVPPNSNLKFKKLPDLYGWHCHFYVVLTIRQKKPPKRERGGQKNRPEAAGSGAVVCELFLEVRVSAQDDGLGVLPGISHKIMVAI